MVFGAFLAFTIVFMICRRLEEVPFSWEGAVQFDRKGIRTSAPVSGPGAARLQPAGTRHPEPKPAGTWRQRPAGTRNPEPEARIHEQSYTRVKKLTLVVF